MDPYTPTLHAEDANPAYSITQVCVIRCHMLIHDMISCPLIPLHGLLERKAGIPVRARLS